MPTLSHPLPATPTPLPTLDDWLSYIEGIHPRSIDLGLQRVQAVARRLGLPQRWPCPAVVVAGTNGKGSTCAMLASIYQQAGYRVGLYTSPHLVHFGERLRLNGEPVEDSKWIAAFATVESARTQKSFDSHGEVSLSYFEFTTLAALHILARSELDVVVLEVGMGGRLDAVNIVDADCAVITSIDLDHMAFLGPDREAIGFEKAGILRTGGPAVVSDPTPPQSVRDRAREIDADVWWSGVDFGFEGDAQQWMWKAAAARGGRRHGGLPHPALRGANQLLNAAGVLAVVEVLRPRLPVTAQALRNGLVLVDWPGRFQILPGRPVVVLDVAHNPQSVAALALNLDAMGFYPATHAVFGAMADKDLGTMLARVRPVVDRWYLCDLPTPRASSAAQLRAALLDAGVPESAVAGCHAGPQQALDAALAAADPAHRIVVFGSFWTVGGVMRYGVPARDAPHVQR